MPRTQLLAFDTQTLLCTGAHFPRDGPPQAKLTVGEEMSNASFSVSEAVYSAGDFRHKVLDGAQTATYRLNLKQDNVAGVKLPVFTPVSWRFAGKPRTCCLLWCGGTCVLCGAFARLHRAALCMPRCVPRSRQDRTSRRHGARS